jgi:hypothetical protein
MKLKKWSAGSYQYGKWSIEKIDGAWLVRRANFILNTLLGITH